MSKIRILYITIAILIISNGILGYFMLQKGPPPHKEGPKQMIINSLGFDDKQVQAYEELIVIHKNEVSSLKQEIRNEKKELFDNLTNSNYNHQQQLSILGDLYTSIEKVNMEHFLDIGELCTSEQHEKFVDLTKEFDQLFKDGPPRKQ